MGWLRAETTAQGEEVLCEQMQHYTKSATPFLHDGHNQPSILHVDCKGKALGSSHYTMLHGH